jgi:hypothetical protein
MKNKNSLNGLDAKPNFSVERLVKESWNLFAFL